MSDKYFSGLYFYLFSFSGILIKAAAVNSHCAVHRRLLIYEAAERSKGFSHSFFGHLLGRPFLYGLTPDVLSVCRLSKLQSTSVGLKVHIQVLCYPGSSADAYGKDSRSHWIQSACMAYSSYSHNSSDYIYNIVGSHAGRLIYV